MADTGWRRYRTALRHRDFRRLIVAFLVDSIGSWASTIVLAVWVYDQTQSLGLLAVLTAANWIPAMVLAPIGGVIADRYDRPTVMTLSAALSAAIFTVVAVVVAVNAAYLLVLVLQVCAAVVSRPYRPAAGALTPDVVDEDALPAANSLFASLENLVVVIGPVVGAVLLLTRAPWIGIAINAVSFAIAAVIASTLRVSSRGDARSGESVAAQFIAGVRAVSSTPAVIALMAFAALDSLVANVYTVVYIPISQHVGLGTTGYGYLLAGCALGGVLGAGLAERLAAARRLAPVILGGLLVQALPYAATALTGSAAVAIALQVVSGAGMVIVDVLAITVIQRDTPPGALSRVLSLLDMALLAAGLVGSFAVAGLLAVVPYRAALVVFGLAVAAVAAALTPLLARADRATRSRAMELAAIVQRLETIDLLNGIPRPGLERLAASARPVQLADQETLVEEGATAEDVYALVGGTLRVSTAGTAASTLPDVHAPDLVGEIGVLRGLPRTATLVAAGPAQLWKIAGQDYLDALTPERIPLLFAGRPATRLARTHAHLVEQPESAA